MKINNNKHFPSIQEKSAKKKIKIDFKKVKFKSCFPHMVYSIFLTYYFPPSLPLRKNFFLYIFESDTMKSSDEDEQFPLNFLFFSKFIKKKITTTTTRQKKRKFLMFFLMQLMYFFSFFIYLFIFRFPHQWHKASSHFTSANPLNQKKKLGKRKFFLWINFHDRYKIALNYE